MIRLVVPLLVVAVAAWVMMYALTPAEKKETWAGVRRAVTVIAIGLAVVAAVILAFSMWGGR